jgi:hypothetical protein
MASKERTIRFVVGTPGGLRSSTWRCWTPTGGKSDIYLARRSLVGSYKIRLHESESWQVGLTCEAERKLKAEGRWTDGWRHAALFPRPTETAPGCVLAFRVLVPESAVSIDSAPESLPGDLMWIPPPPQDRAVEIALILTAPGSTTDGWPGKRAMATGLVGSFPLDSGEYLWLVHREVPIPAIPSAQGRISRFKPAPEYSQPLENARVIVGIDVDGMPSAVMVTAVREDFLIERGPIRSVSPAAVQSLSELIVTQRALPYGMRILQGM